MTASSAASGGPTSRAGRWRKSRPERAARAFVLDDAVARMVNEIAFAVPELLAESQVFARAPFAETWIEFEQPSLVGSVLPEHAGLLPRHGFLISDGIAYSSAGDALDALRGRVNRKRSLKAHLPARAVSVLDQLGAEGIELTLCPTQMTMRRVAASAGSRS